MSISNIEKPNQKHLYCGKLTVDELDVQPIYGAYARSGAIGYSYAGNVNPSVMAFDVTKNDNGITRTGDTSTTFTVSADGKYSLTYDGYCFSSANISQLKLAITVNGIEVDNKCFRQSAPAIFQGGVCFNSVLDLSAGDVVRMTINPDVEPVTITFTVLGAGQHSQSLSIIKL